MIHAIGDWLYAFFGISGSGSHYGWWSGTGSDIGELAIIGSMWALYRKHNCPVRRCPRICRYDVVGTPFQSCKKHHPEIPTKGHITPQHIVDACGVDHDRKDHTHV